MNRRTATTRLEQLRTILRSESISQGELHELQCLAKWIDRGDVELLEAAGVPETAEDLSFIELGNIMLKEAGEARCQSGYNTTDPEWVGRYAIAYGDINPNGVLN